MSQPQTPKLNARQLKALQKIAKMDANDLFSWGNVHRGTVTALERRGLVESKEFPLMLTQIYSMTQAGRDYLDGLGED